MMTLTWNHENSLAYPNSVPGDAACVFPFKPDMERGLKDKGFLFVEERYRRRGIAVSLESYLINRQVEKGYIPYCHVRTENAASHHLQEKLGLFLAPNPVWWVSGSEQLEEPEADN